jgi:hypothetical protein
MAWKLGDISERLATPPSHDATARLSLWNMNRFGLTLALIPLTLFVTGCTDGLGYDQRGGLAIADHIRELSSPLVSTVDYRAGNFMDSATIDITLMLGVADEDAKAFVCEVALPWAESSDPPDGLGIDVWDSASKRIVASDLDCR